jgi:hypothetical protein
LIPPDGSIPPEGPGDAADRGATEPAEPAAGPASSRLFSLEGRAAPALFVLAWLATIGGAAILFVALQAEAGVGKFVLFVGGLVLLSIGLVSAAGSQGIERRARGGAAYAGPSPILVFLATIPTSFAVLVLLGVPLELAGIDPDGPAVAVVALLINAIVYVGLVRLLVVDAGVLSWSAMGVRPLTRAGVVDFLVGAAWAFPVIFLTGIVASLLVGLLDVVPESPLPPSREPIGIGLNLVAAGVLAPIGEEIFFRAFATTAWVTALGANRGILRGGLFFAFVHVLTIEASDPADGAALAVVGFLTRVPVGLALGWLFVRRGSIWAPLGLHVTFNAVLVLVAAAL